VWDLLLTYAEFTYNKAPSKAIGLSPFKVVYGIDPFGPLDLVLQLLDQKSTPDAKIIAEEIQKIHEQVKITIEKSKQSYHAQANKHKKKVIFKPRDLVWINLPKERFPSKRKGKLMPRANGPFEVLENINENAYKVDLSGNYGVLTTFSVANMSQYFDDGYLTDLRANFSQGENDTGLSILTSHGPNRSQWSQGGSSY